MDTTTLTPNPPENDPFLKNTDREEISEGEDKTRDPEGQGSPASNVANPSKNDPSQYDGMSQGSDSNEEKEVEKHDLENDIFSVFFTSETFSVPFNFAVFIASLQIVILSLCLYDKVKDPIPGNPLKIPPSSTTVLILSQALALLISIFLSSDIVNALHVFDVKHDGWKWYMANFLRFAVGSLGLVVTFIFIIQEEGDPLDLFLNFAAVQFVSELDEIAYSLAEQGVLHAELKKATGVVCEVKLNLKGKTKLEWKSYFYAFLGAIAFVAWIILVARQQLNYYVRPLYETQCQSFEMKLGDLTEDFSYNFFSRCSNYEDDDEKRCPEIWETDLNATIRYNSFNDIYHAARNNEGKLVLEDRRPVYYQRNTRGMSFSLGEPSYGQENDGPNPFPPGKIRYCQNIGAWVFTIKGVRKGASANDCSWLLKSPETEANNLAEVPEEDWVVWDGSYLTETTVDITCIECSAPVDCTFQGVCKPDTKMCECHEPRMGFQCETCARWEKMTIDLTNVDVKETTFDALPSKLNVEILKKNNVNRTEIYGNPVFYSKEESDQIPSIGNYWVMINTGSRYAIYHMKIPSKVSLHDYLQNFHSSWTTYQDSEPLVESEIADGPLLNFNVRWYYYNSDTRQDKDGKEVKISFECLDGCGDRVCELHSA